MVAVRRISKTQAQQWLGDVPGDKVFYCCNGEIYRNLRELESALERMRDDHFVYHVNPEKNDFSNWVRDVIGDQKLAQDLRGCKTRQDAQTIVRERVNFFSKRSS